MSQQLVAFLFVLSILHSTKDLEHTVINKKHHILDPPKTTTKNSPSHTHKHMNITLPQLFGLDDWKHTKLVQSEAGNNECHNYYNQNHQFVNI